MLKLLGMETCFFLTRKSTVIDFYFSAASHYYIHRCGLLLQTEERDLSVCRSVGLSVCHDRKP